MTDTTDTDDLTPDGEGTPLGEAERSREEKDERIRELGGIPAHELEEWLPRGLRAAAMSVENWDVKSSLREWADAVEEKVEAAD